MKVLVATLFLSLGLATSSLGFASDPDLHLHFDHSSQSLSPTGSVSRTDLHGWSSAWRMTEQAVLTVEVNLSHRPHVALRSRAKATLIWASVDPTPTGYLLLGKGMPVPASAEPIAAEYIRLWLHHRGGCGVAIADLGPSDSEGPGPGQLDDAPLPSHPVCGTDMGAISESFKGVDAHTCFEDGESPEAALQMITYLLEAHRPTWIYAPIPRVDSRPSPPARPGLPWNLPADCHPAFPRSGVDAGQPQRNVGFEFGWSSDGQLVTIQGWMDDVETGMTIVVHDNGLPATVGYRWEGLPHGVWFYLAPDGTLVDARLFGLGVELAHLPVETLR